MVLSYCVVNTNGRDLLMGCLDAIRDTAPAGAEYEVIVVDNASGDGSPDAVAARDEEIRLIALDRRAGYVQNVSRLLREADGRYCLLLDEDAQLQPGAAGALLQALDAEPRAAAAAAQLLDPAGRPRPCAWRLPGVGTALAGALFLHRLVTVQSRGGRIRAVGWAQSAAMLVRRSAAADVGFMDPAFFLYSGETDLCKRLRDAGWRTLYVPAARAVHREQLSSDRQAGERRIVEFHRGRDHYLRKHHGRVVAAMVRPLAAWPYLVRALAAVALPGHDPRRHLLHARQALRPWRGAGIREAVDELNRRRAAMA